MLHWTDASSSGRFTLWKECLAMFKAHWLTGVGPGGENFLDGYLPFSSGVLPFTPPHANMGYLDAAVSVGIVGWVGYMLFFFQVFPLLHRVRQSGKAEIRLTAAALEAALAGAAAANIPEQIWFYPRILWFWCALYGAALGLYTSISKPGPP